MRHRTRFRTQFCFITPTAYLDRYASVSRTHLVLPQILDPKYIAYYQRKRKEGDLIILDNGAYELKDSVDFEALAKAIYIYKPQVAALPDFLMQDGEKTLQASVEFRDFYRKWDVTGFEPKWMYIPQSEPGPHGYQNWKRWMNEGIKKLAPDWIGIPRALATHIAHPLARVDIVEELTMRGIKTHCLGMAGGDLRELELLFWEGACSIDSSCAVWRGIHCSNLRDSDHQSRWREYGPEMDFGYSQPLTDNQQFWVRNNMNLILKTVGQEEI